MLGDQLVDNRQFTQLLAENDITLTRNVFFSLLGEAINFDDPEQYLNMKLQLFCDLMELIGVDCSKLKLDLNCLINYDDTFRYLKAACSDDSMDDENRINAFLNELCNNYNSVICKMIRITEKYFNSKQKNDALVTSLIEFIRNDDSIPNQMEFVTSLDGTKLSKQEMIEKDEITIGFEPFILDVLRYVFALRNTKDAKGIQTFNTVCLLKYRFNNKNCAFFRGCIKKINEQSDRIVTLTHLE